MPKRVNVPSSPRVSVPYAYSYTYTYANGLGRPSTPVFAYANAYVSEYVYVYGLGMAVAGNDYRDSVISPRDERETRRVGRLDVRRNRPRRRGEHRLGASQARGRLGLRQLVQHQLRAQL